MKVLVDKKTNLARGFADLETPNEHAEDLLFSIGERMAKVKADIAKADARIAELKLDQSERSNDLLLNALNGRKSLMALLAETGRQANTRVDYNKLLIERLRTKIPRDVFDYCRKLARMDKEYLLSKIAVEFKE